MIAEDRYLREQRDRKAGQQWECAGLAQPLAENQRQPDAGEIEGQAAHDLVRLEADGDHGMNLAQQSGGQHPHYNGQPGVVGAHGGRQGAHRADQHHAFDAEVHHARSLGEDFADGREKQHRSGRNTRREDNDRVHGARPPATGALREHGSAGEDRWQ
jgi:hypothetical protein